MLGEFDCVANQIDQDLTQARGITPHHRGDFRGEREEQLDALLMRLEGQRTAGVRNQLKRRKIDLFQGKTPGLDAGEVEDVIDDDEQRLRRRLHRIQVITLLVCEFGIEQQIGHAQHAIHGRADLMTHVRQEVAFGPARSLGGLLRRNQRSRTPVACRRAAEPLPAPLRLRTIRGHASLFATQRLVHLRPQRKPSTSCMSNRPLLRPCKKRAALKEPNA